MIAAVLGYRGERIKDVIQQSGVSKIDIPKSASFGTDFVVRIIGELECILKATSLIYEVLLY